MNSEKKYSSLLGVVATLLIFYSLNNVNQHLGAADSSFAASEIHDGSGVLRWYYDLNTSQLFSGPVGIAVPCEAPSGIPFEGKPAGVLAVVYECGECNNNQDEPMIIVSRFVQNSRITTWFRRAESSEWMIDSGDAVQMMVKGFKKECPEGQRLRQCMP